MRYKSLQSVDFILIDGRSRLKILQTVMSLSLVALNERLQYHVVVLCSSRKQADTVDLLGEQCGQELFFHGEYVENIEEFRALLRASQLFIVPAKSRMRALAAYRGNQLAVPLLIVESTGGSSYVDGKSLVS